MKFKDYLSESDDDKKSMFKRAKSIALRFAKSMNRSTNGINKSQNASDLKNTISSWKDSSNAKTRATYKSVDNALKNNHEEDKSDETETKDTEDDKNTETVSKDVEDTKKLLKPDESKEYEYAVKKEQNDIERISKELLDNEELRKASIEHMNDFLTVLLKKLSSSEDIDLSNIIDNVDNRIDMANQLTDALDALKEYKDTVNKDYNDKMKAQDQMIHDKEELLKHEISPDVKEYEENRIKKYEEKLKEKLSNNFILSKLHSDYMYFKNKEPLTDEEMKEFRQILDGDYGKLIDQLNKEFKPLSDEEKEKLNTRYREVELNDIRKKAENNKNMLTAEYNKSIHDFECDTRDFEKNAKRIYKTLISNDKIKTFSTVSTSKITKFKNDLDRFKEQAQQLYDRLDKIKIKDEDENDNEEESKNKEM